ncbi:MAG: integrase domain-containing protein [Candidatus Methylumidiphilus sp.]
MAARNFGLGSRDMKFAAGLLLAKLDISFSSREGIGDRWNLFVDWAKLQGINKMEKIDKALVIRYGEYLQTLVAKGDMKPATAQVYVSAVNTVMDNATGHRWEGVSPTKDCGIGKRCHIPTESKAMPEAKHREVRAKVDDRVAVMLELQRTYGLRFKESALLDAKAALKEAVTKGTITLTSGTKGGRKRTVPAPRDTLVVLGAAAKLQDGRSMIPKAMTYAEFRRDCYSQAYAAGFGFHQERHHYAQRRYTELTGVPSPVQAGWTGRQRIAKMAAHLGVSKSVATKIDTTARLTLSKELGHNRIEVTRVYTG